MKRDGTVGAPAIFAASVSITSRAPSSCAKSCGGKTDTPLRQIEPEVESHRAAQPRIGAAVRRPGAFDQAAEHDAVAFGQARFEQAEDAHAQTRPQRPADDTPLGEQRVKKLDIVRRRDGKARRGIDWSPVRRARRRACRHRVRQTPLARRRRCDSAASTSRCRAADSRERMRLAADGFQRRQRRRQRAHKICGGREFGRRSKRVRGSDGCRSLSSLRGICRAVV